MDHCVFTTSHLLSSLPSLPPFLLSLLSFPPALPPLSPFFPSSLLPPAFPPSPPLPPGGSGEEENEREEGRGEESGWEGGERENGREEERRGWEGGGEERRKRKKFSSPLPPAHSLPPSSPPAHSLPPPSLPPTLFLPPSSCPLSPSLHVPPSFLSQIENIIRHDLAARFDRCQQDMIKALWQKERRFPQMYNLKPEIAFHGTLSKSLPSIGEIAA